MWEKSIFCGKAVKTFPQSVLKSVGFSAQTADDGMDESRGYGGQRHQQREEKFTRGKRNGSQDRAADVGEDEL